MGTAVNISGTSFSSPGLMHNGQWTLMSGFTIVTPHPGLDPPFGGAAKKD